MRYVALGFAVMVGCFIVTPCFAQEPSTPSFSERLRQRLAEDKGSTPSFSQGSTSSSSGLGGFTSSGSRAADLLNGGSGTGGSSLFPGGSTSGLGGSRGLSRTLEEHKKWDDMLRPHIMLPQPKPVPWWQEIPGKILALVKTVFGIVAIGVFILFALGLMMYGGMSARMSLKARGGVERNELYKKDH